MPPGHHSVLLADQACLQKIGQAFALANNKAALAQLEVTEELGQPISNYDSQNIRNTLVHHLSELSHKRRWVPAAAPDTLAQVGYIARP